MHSPAFDRAEMALVSPRPPRRQVEAIDDTSHPDVDCLRMLPAAMAG